MRRLILGLTLPALVLAGAPRAGAGGLDVRLGGFFPLSESCANNAETVNPNKACFFQDLHDLYTPNGTAETGVTRGDFNGVFGGIEYNTVVAPNFEVGISLDGHRKTLDTSYRDYTRPSGAEIQQTLKLSVIPLGATVRFVPTAKSARLAPFVGVGVDAIFYDYEEVGDFVDVFDPTLPIVADRFKDNGATLGAHGEAGVRVYLNRDFAIVAQGKYLWAKRKDMGHDFLPNPESGLINRIDLSGASFTVGLHVRF